LAFNSEVGNLGEAWEQALKERRKMYIEGDAAKYARLHNALLAHVSSLSAAIPAVVRQAKRNTVALPEWEPPPLQVAHLTTDTESPLLQGIRGWLMFSAVSSIFGNAGQSNYCAANMVMDQLSFWTRQNRSQFEAITMMWGTVGHMGMRWKAFGSADMIYKDPNSSDIVMMPADAQVVLRTIFTSSVPEWFVANTFDKGTTALFAAGGPPLPSNPWGNKKGKGGGITVTSEVLPEQVAEAEKSTAPGKRPCEGRRVRLHGLVKSPEMNGKKGTLLEETKDGLWIVRLDGKSEDKLLKLDNMMTLSGTPLAA
jgi:hypothetical protein